MRSPGRSLLLIVALLASSSAGCLTRVGECDPVAAREVVFLDTGTDVDGQNGWPMYAGQALVQSSCGNGQFCHSSEAEGPRRFGAPRSLEFDFGLACGGGPCPPHEQAMDPLVASQHVVLDHAHALIASVADGRMPPGGVGGYVASRSPHFHRIDLAPGAQYTLRHEIVSCDNAPTGTCAPGQTTYMRAHPVLPAAASPEGQEILRNWLACGAPVVESTDDPSTTQVTGGDCSIPGEQGHVGSCVVRVAAPLSKCLGPTWDSIYAYVIGPRCGTSCHNPNDASYAGALDLSNQEGAYANLVDDVAQGSGCRGLATLVVPGRPESSLLMAKLATEQDLDKRLGVTLDIPFAARTCGALMPTGPSRLDFRVLEVIRAWIAAGAVDSHQSAPACPPND